MREKAKAPPRAMHGGAFNVRRADRLWRAADSGILRLILSPGAEIEQSAVGDWRDARYRLIRDNVHHLGRRSGRRRLYRNQPVIMAVGSRNDLSRGGPYNGHQSDTCCR